MLVGVLPMDKMIITQTFRMARWQNCCQKVRGNKPNQRPLSSKVVVCGHSLFRVQELCESRGGRPGLSVPMSLPVSVDVKQHWTMLTDWSQFVPNNYVNPTSARTLRSTSSTPSCDIPLHSYWNFKIAAHLNVRVRVRVILVMMMQSFMSSDVGWHIRDKPTSACAWYNVCFTSTETIGLIRTGEPRTATSTITQILNGDCPLMTWGLIKLMSSDIGLTIRDNLHPWFPRLFCFRSLSVEWT